MNLAAVSLAFLASTLLTAALNWLALRPWRRSEGQHWSERARRLYPARISGLTNCFLLPAAAPFAARLLSSESPPAAIVVAAFLGALLGGYPLDRAIFPELRFPNWLRLVIANWLLISAPLVLTLVAILTMPTDFGALTWMFAGALALLLVVFHLGLGIQLLRWTGLLHPAGERCRRIVAESSARMAVPVRTNWELDSPQSNAYVLPVPRALVFTRKLLATHPDDEVAAICAHELGHLTESRRALAGRIVGSFALFPLIFTRPVDAAAGLPGLALLAGAAALMWIARLRLSRKLEKRADRIATEQQAATALYARALERLYQTNQMPAVLPRRTSKTHPDLYDRMLAAGVTPDFPRPAPARSRGWTGWLTLATFAVLLLVYAFRA